MSIQSVLSTSSLFNELSSTSSTSSSSTATASSQNSFDTALANLFTAIQNGDTSSAQSYLAQVQKLEPSNADSSSPLGTFLSSVSSALSNDDISSAQTALTTLENTTPTGSTLTVGQMAATSVELSDVATGVLQLFSAISSGNTSEAQSAYDSLTSIFGSDSSSSSSSTDTSSTSSSTSSSSESFTTLLADIGGALSTNDISSAQTAMDTYLQSLSAGSIVSTQA